VRLKLKIRNHLKAQKFFFEEAEKIIENEAEQTQ
jgi:hypothetical protein